MGAEQIHDKYGKKVLKKAFNNSYDDKPDKEPFGNHGGSMKIDGTIGNDIAVEVESRASKQVRGASVDIICHPFPKKLVVLIGKYGNKYTENQCRYLLDRFAPNAKSCVVTLKGDGRKGYRKYKVDAKIVQDVVEQLRKPRGPS